MCPLLCCYPVYRLRFLPGEFGFFNSSKPFAKTVSNFMLTLPLAATIVFILIGSDVQFGGIHWIFWLILLLQLSVATVGTAEMIAASKELKVLMLRELIYNFRL